MVTPDAAASIEPFSILIPERGRPDLLEATLTALTLARQAINVPHRVRLLVNGAPPNDYTKLRCRHPDIEWSFTPQALGFHGAIQALVDGESQPWVYLLNSDMCLAPNALAAILPWRNADVFAVASQIEFADRTRRREETGYTLPVLGPDGQLELHDREPIDASVRGNLYAGGGASLFQTALLRRYLALSRAYAPFYFEDADWSLQAWADGYRVLFCAASQAVHEHRGTIGRYLAAATVDRVVHRNLAHFRWRYGDLFGAPRGPWRAWTRALSREHRDARRRVGASVIAAGLKFVHQQRYPHAQRWRALPRVLLVAAAGLEGAGDARLALVRASSEHIDWVLLHAGAAVATASTDDDALFREIHPVSTPVAQTAVLQGLTASLRPRLIVFADGRCSALLVGWHDGRPPGWLPPVGAEVAELMARLAEPI